MPRHRLHDAYDASPPAWVEPAPPPVWQRQIRWPALQRWHAVLLVSFSAVIVALFSDAILAGRAFFERDILIVWTAQVEAFVRAVAAASWPVWDPTVSFGHPLLANPNTQVFYPPTWLHLVMRPEVQYTFYVVAHCYLAAIGLYRLSVRLGLSREAALLAACLFITSGPFLALLNVWHHFAGAAWMPWVILAAENALEAGTLFTAAVWGLSSAIQVLTGSPDLCVYTHLIALVQVLRRLAPRAPFGVANRRVLGVTVAAYVFAAGLSAAQWLPTLALARSSARMALSNGERAFWSLHPAALAQILFPLSFEDLPRYASGSSAVGRLFELWSPFMSWGYLGLVALGLVAAALVGPRRRNRGFLLGTGSAALLLALGHHTPVHDLLVRLVPPVGILRYPSKALALVALSWSLLAGMGFDTWRDGMPPRRRRAAAGALAAAVAVGWIAVLLSWPRVAGSPLALRIGVDGPLWAEVVSANRTPLLVSTVLASVGLAVMVLPRLAWLHGGSAVALAVLAALDPIAANRTVNTTAARGFFNYRPPILDVIRPVRGGEPAPRVYVWDYVLRAPGRGHPTQGMLGTFMDVPTNWPPRLSSALAMESYLYPPSFGRWGLAGSYDRDLLGLYPGPLKEMVLALRAVEDTAAYLRLLQLGGVDYVVALHDEDQYGLVAAATVRGLYRKPIHVFRVPDTLPRTYAVGCARSAPSPEVLERVLDPAFEPRREIVLSEAQGGGCEEAFSGASRIVDFRPDRVTIEAELSAPGWVVLLDSYDPGWRAKVDGTETDVLPANAIFRAVPVSSGLHRIELAYRPRALLWGLFITCAFVIGGLFLASRADRSWAGFAPRRGHVPR